MLLVALRKESVDRNCYVIDAFEFLCVALRKESVDRNTAIQFRRNIGVVALRKESVDRNNGNVCAVLGDCRRSPQGERG